MIKLLQRALGFIFFSSLFTIRFFAAEGDWPQWRGPNRDDVSTEKALLQDWPAGGPPLSWKATGLGEGYSTVAIQGGRIYTIGDRKDASFVIAVNLADGKPVWAAKLGQPGAPGWGGFSGPRSTPTVNGKLLFALGGTLAQRFDQRFRRLAARVGIRRIAAGRCRSRDLYTGRLEGRDRRRV